MLTITGRNVNDLWSDGMHALASIGVAQDSRAGRVLVAPHPVVSVYRRPVERVLFDPVRDANPFFHLMESLWMLAGRDDAAFLDRYVGDFGRRFGDGPDDARYIHGAYGHRWRRTFNYDQLDVVVNKLRANPDDRQAVIQMWDGINPSDGHHCGSGDLLGDWRDRPCNTHVYLRVRDEKIGSEPVGRIVTLDPATRQPAGSVPTDERRPIYDKVLDLTVCCRSNDIVFGAYGANAVHFSVLQEYLAGRIGVGVGRMYQFSNNWHGYVDVLQKFGDPLLGTATLDPYQQGRVSAMPMGSAWGQWDADLSKFMRWHDERLWRPHGEGLRVEYVNSWFSCVAERVAFANWCWKSGERAAALYWAENIDATDWREACVQWIKRRMK